ncbi:hypothetical protein C8T65DRAFT_70440 [Cerioporus squamosus]|nr:hypothetical protein C8T65DRAFT_70440 [Cerioporus squamosus]
MFTDVRKYSHGPHNALTLAGTVRIRMWRTEDYGRRAILHGISPTSIPSILTEPSWHTAAETPWRRRTGGGGRCTLRRADSRRIELRTWKPAKTEDVEGREAAAAALPARCQLTAGDSRIYAVAGSGTGFPSRTTPTAAPLLDRKRARDALRSPPAAAAGPALLCMCSPCASVRLRIPIFDFYRPLRAAARLCVQKARESPGCGCGLPSRRDRAQMA